MRPTVYGANWRPARRWQPASCSWPGAGRELRSKPRPRRVSDPMHLFNLGRAVIQHGLPILGLTACAYAQMPDPPGQVKGGAQPTHEAYLFAHMMHGDYWRLHYSVSLDGLHWEM